MVIFDIIDIVVFCFFLVATIYSWKIYRKTFSPQTSYLFVGFLLSTILQVGFVVINYIPIMSGQEIFGMSTNRFIGELTVFLRIFPSFFIMIGMVYLFKSVKKYMNGNGKEF